jgi:hypothetical protein
MGADGTQQIFVLYCQITQKNFGYNFESVIYFLIDRWFLRLLLFGYNFESAIYFLIASLVSKIHLSLRNNIIC